MAEHYATSVFRQTDVQLEHDLVSDQRFVSRPFLEHGDPITDALYNDIGRSSDSDSDSDSVLDLLCESSFGDEYEGDEYADTDLEDLSVLYRMDEFSMSDGRISNSDPFEEEVEEEWLGFGLDRSVVTPGLGESSVSNLRVAGIDSELVNDEVLNMDGYENSEEQLGGNVLWDGLGLEEQMSDSRELGWEEIEETDDDEREGMMLLLDQIEEMSDSSSFSRYDVMNGISEVATAAAEESLDWEDLDILVRRNRQHSYGSEADDGGDDIDSYLAVQDDYTSDRGENSIDILQNNIQRGGPPTAEYIKKNLPCLVLTEEELQKENLVCAVCKDGMAVNEKITMLPCNHHYHWECIIPWLNVRNTCPLCRYELPTDDMDYDLRRNQEAGVGLGGDSDDGYNYEWLV